MDFEDSSDDDEYLPDDQEEEEDDKNLNLIDETFTLDDNEMNVDQILDPTLTLENRTRSHLSLENRDLDELDRLLAQDLPTVNGLVEEEPINPISDKEYFAFLTAIRDDVSLVGSATLNDDDDDDEFVPPENQLQDTPIQKVNKSELYSLYGAETSVEDENEDVEEIEDANDDDERFDKSKNPLGKRKFNDFSYFGLPDREFELLVRLPGSNVYIEEDERIFFNKDMFVMLKKQLRQYVQLLIQNFILMSQHKDQEYLLKKITFMLVELFSRRVESNEHRKKAVIPSAECIKNLRKPRLTRGVLNTIPEGIKPQGSSSNSILNLPHFANLLRTVKSVKENAEKNQELILSDADGSISNEKNLKTNTNNLKGKEIKVKEQIPLPISASSENTDSVKKKGKAKKNKSNDDDKISEMQDSITKITSFQESIPLLPTIDKAVSMDIENNEGQELRMPTLPIAGEIAEEKKEGSVVNPIVNKKQTNAASYRARAREMKKKSLQYVKLSKPNKSLLHHFDPLLFENILPKSSENAFFKFVDAEDQLLAYGLMKYTLFDFNSIHQELLPTRSKKQLANRAKNVQKKKDKVVEEEGYFGSNPIKKWKETQLKYKKENSRKEINFPVIYLEPPALFSDEIAVLKLGKSRYNFDFQKIHHNLLPIYGPQLLRRKWIELNNIKMSKVSNVESLTMDGDSHGSEGDEESCVEEVKFKIDGISVENAFQILTKLFESETTEIDILEEDEDLPKNYNWPERYKVAARGPAKPSIAPPKAPPSPVDPPSNSKSAENDSSGTVKTKKRKFSHRQGKKNQQPQQQQGDMVGHSELSQFAIDYLNSDNVTNLFGMDNSIFNINNMQHLASNAATGNVMMNNDNSLFSVLNRFPADNTNIILPLVYSPSKPEETLFSLICTEEKKREIASKKSEKNTSLPPIFPTPLPPSSIPDNNTLSNFNLQESSLFPLLNNLHTNHGNNNNSYNNNNNNNNSLMMALNTPFCSENTMNMLLNGGNTINLLLNGDSLFNLIPANSNKESSRSSTNNKNETTESKQVEEKKVEEKDEDGDMSAKPTSFSGGAFSHISEIKRMDSISSTPPPSNRIAIRSRESEDSKENQAVDKQINLKPQQLDVDNVMKASEGGVIKWKQKEDKELLIAVKKNGVKEETWKKLSLKTNGKTSSDYSARYLFLLDMMKRKK